MRGQSAEYVVVFAAVVSMAVLILAQAYPSFPHLTYDVGALVNGVSSGYSYELNTFRDGAVSLFYTSYSKAGHDVNVYLHVVGWPFSDVNAAVVSTYSKLGYTVRVNP